MEHILSYFTAKTENNIRKRNISLQAHSSTIKSEQSEFVTFVHPALIQCWTYRKRGFSLWMALFWLEFMYCYATKSSSLDVGTGISKPHRIQEIAAMHITRDDTEPWRKKKDEILLQI